MNQTKDDSQKMFKPLTEEFTARILMINGYQVIYKKADNGYEFVGIITPSTIPVEHGDQTEFWIGCIFGKEKEVRE